MNHQLLLDTISWNTVLYMATLQRVSLNDMLPQHFHLEASKWRYDLPTEPHPPTNNPGGWLYTLKELKESTSYVFTVNQMKKNKKR